MSSMKMVNNDKETIPVNATYHGVEIKCVEIINASNTVKFKDCDAFPEQHGMEQNLSPNYLTTNESEKRKSNYNTLQIEEKKEDLNEDQIKQLTYLINEMSYQDKQVNDGTLPIVALMTKSREAITDSRTSKKMDDVIENHNEQKQRLREKLLHRKREMMNVFAQYTRSASAKPQKRNSSSKFYEVSPGVVIPERPISRVTSGSGDNRYERRLNSRVSAPSRASILSRQTKRLSATKRSSSSRPISWNSSSQFRFEDQMASRQNLFVKMPFKQVPVLTLDSSYSVPEELISPNDELRLTTAFTVSRVRHAINRQILPSRQESRQGRLLKAKLKPLEPVSNNKGPQIYSCRGIQPERRKKITNSPPPSRLRQLKAQYLEMCKKYDTTDLENEYIRRLKSTSPVQSIHPTSPQPDEPDAIDEDRYFVHKNTFFGELDPINNHDSESTVRNDQLNYHTSVITRLDSNIIY